MTENIATLISIWLKGEKYNDEKMDLCDALHDDYGDSAASFCSH